MSEHKPQPGVSRGDRISDDGLDRLRKQLSLGNKPSVLVLQQWVKRYGDAAIEVITEAGYEPPEHKSE